MRAFRVYETEDKKLFDSESAAILWEVWGRLEAQPERVPVATTKEFSFTLFGYIEEHRVWLENDGEGDEEVNGEG